MRGDIPVLLRVAAALPVVASLRVQTAHRSAVEDFRQLCGGGAPPADLVERGLECDPEIPRYDMDEWIAKHGNKAPDHPAVFVGTHTNFTQEFPDMETFLAKHGDERITALPEYATSGGALKTPMAQGRITATFRELLDSWNDTFVYFSDFKCEKDSLCLQAAERFGKPTLFATKSLHSKNFLVGGPDSGLPFHKHGMTWQGLSMGRKAWYMLPPGSMTEEMHDATGPYIFPVRTYHPLMQKRKLGARPLYCVQNPGEVLFVPEFWWHSTMNLDRYQVAYGEKPIQKIQPRSQELDKILSYFPAQAYDSAGYTRFWGRGDHNLEDPMVYTLMAREQRLKSRCNATDMDGAEYGMELPMSRMRNLTGSTLMKCGLAETVAFAHCMMAGFVDSLVTHCSGKPDAQLIQQDSAARSKRWRQAAYQFSPALVRRESGICGLQGGGGADATL